MSWDSYIDNILGHCNTNCDKACIIGLDGSKWTSDGHANAFKLQGNESVTVGGAFKIEDFTTFQASGIVLGGVKYQFLRAMTDDGMVVLGKKKDNGSVTMEKCKTCVVIGHTKEGGAQGDTNKGVHTVAEYLISLNM